MRREDRSRAQALEAAVQRHEKAVARADTTLLTALHDAGFEQLHTVKGAYARLRAQRHLPGLTQHQIDTVLAFEESQKDRR